MSRPPREVTPLQYEYIDWWMDPLRKGTIKEWAAAHGLQPRAVHGWQHKPMFRQALRKRLDQLNVAPDRVQEILDNLHDLAATRRDATAVQAAKTYLSYVERLEPQRKPIEDRAIKDLTPQELREQLEAALADTQLRAVGESA